MTTGWARVIEEDESITFTLPWDEGCTACEGEWEPLFPPAPVPQELPLPEESGPGTELLLQGVADVPNSGEDVPEPVTWLLIGGGLTGMAWWRRRSGAGAQ